MSESGSFRVTLGVSHESRGAQEILNLIDRPVRSSKSAGEPRVTSSGRVLGGVYERTYVRFDLSDGVRYGSEAPFEDLLGDIVRSLSKATLSHMKMEGYSFLLLIGVFSEENFVCDFDLDVVKLMSDMGLRLRIDFYGGPGNE